LNDQDDQDNQNGQGMEEVPIQINCLNTFLSDFDYAASANWDIFGFDGDFNKSDEGQLQNQPNIPSSGGVAWQGPG
jgi:hypothetical protein